MGLLELFITAVGLSADAFSASVCKGLSNKKQLLKTAILCGIWFGGFQALMPAIGYVLGSFFVNFIQKIDHWVAFILLCFIGINMVKESREAACPVDTSADTVGSMRSYFLLAVATSIDALAVGVTFAFLKVNIWFAVLFIGVCTFVLSMLGVYIGAFFGTRYKSRAEFAGGLILIAMGIKIFAQHLMQGI